MCSSGLQAYVYKKNEHNKIRSSEPALYLSLKREIFKTKSSRYLHVLSRQIKTDDNWQLLQFVVMRDVVSSRMRYVPGFKDSLISSGTVQLLNADCYDTFWGVGLNYKSVRWTKESDLCGRNHLGVILMDMRKVLCLT